MWPDAEGSCWAELCQIKFSRTPPAQKPRTGSGHRAKWDVAGLQVHPHPQLQAGSSSRPARGTGASPPSGTGPGVTKPSASLLQLTDVIPRLPRSRATAPPNQVRCLGLGVKGQDPLSLPVSEAPCCQVCSSSWGGQVTEPGSVIVLGRKGKDRSVRADVRPCPSAGQLSHPLRSAVSVEPLPCGLRLPLWQEAGTQSPQVRATGHPWTLQGASRAGGGHGPGETLGARAAFPSFQRTRACA